MHDEKNTTFGAAAGNDIGTAARKVREGASELRDAVESKGRGLVDSIADFTAERPMAALGIAFGIGYVLGGGLFSRTTGRLVAIATRLGAAALVKELFAEMASRTRASAL